MIETNTDKAQSWQAEEVTETATASKPRRKRTSRGRCLTSRW
jgi:hypothetical protein